MNHFAPAPLAREFDPTRRADYGFATVENLRFADLDVHGHINNVSYLTFFENARVSYIDREMPGLAEHGLGVVLAHVDIDYRSQLYYPGTIEAVAQLLEVRRSALVIAQAVFDPQGVCAASGRAVAVVFDRRANRSQPVPDSLRPALARLLQPGPKAQP